MLFLMLNCIKNYKYVRCRKTSRVATSKTDRISSEKETESDLIKYSYEPPTLAKSKEKVILSFVFYQI